MRAPLLVEVDLTNECNLACPHCSRTGVRLPDELSVGEFQNVIDQLSELGVFLITISGAESSLRSDSIDIVEYAHARDLEVVMSTNLNREMKDDAAKRLSEVTLKVATSLDGPTAAVNDSIRGPGTFERTLRGIDALLRNGCRVMVESTVLIPNLGAFPDIVDLADRIGVQELLVNVCMPVGRAATNYASVVPSEHDLRNVINRVNEKAKARPRLQIHLPSQGMLNPLARMCDCSIDRCSIAADGKVYPCSNFHSYADMAAGDLRNSTFLSIWNESPLLSLLRERSMAQESGCPAALRAINRLDVFSGCKNAVE